MNAECHDPLTFIDDSNGNCFFVVVNIGSRWVQQDMSTFDVMCDMYYKVIYNKYTLGNMFIIKYHITY